MKKRIFAVLLAIGLSAAAVTGCGSGQSTDSPAGSQTTENEEKTFVFGDTTFNAENGESDLNPHNDNSGWACIRYGVGETLFRFTDNMEIEPWLAESYENIDELTWKITLREGITFTSGRTMDAEAVKECLEDLVENHVRAAGDLHIAEIAADGMELTIRTEEPVPALMNYLADPYGCIYDVQAGVTEDGIVQDHIWRCLLPRTVAWSW